jgi:hypothetical protein
MGGRAERRAQGAISAGGGVVEQRGAGQARPHIPQMAGDAMKVPMTGRPRESKRSRMVRLVEEIVEKFTNLSI